MNLNEDEILFCPHCCEQNRANKAFQVFCNDCKKMVTFILKNKNAYCKECKKKLNVTKLFLMTKKLKNFEDYAHNIDRDERLVSYNVGTGEIEINDKRIKYFGHFEKFVNSLMRLLNRYENKKINQYEYFLKKEKLIIGMEKYISKVKEE
jgi:hypothetical protein